MRFLRWLGSALVLVALLPVGVAIGARFSDGPLEFFPGGPLRAGPLVAEANPDWAAVLAEKGEGSPVELELVEPGTSRTTGIMLHEGQLYVPCDLGFMWRRFGGFERVILHGIYLFKHWHQDAERDGRVVLRIAGRRYPLQAVRVYDAALQATLRSQLEDMARRYLDPAPLGPAPTEPPNDVWFFRLDPRPVAAP